MIQIDKKKKHQKDKCENLNEEIKDLGEEIEDLEQEIKNEEPAADQNKDVQQEAPKSDKAEENPEPEKAEDPLAKAGAEIDVLNDKYLRLCAEYDNFRKRSQKEKDSLYGDIKANVLTSFLPVFDNLERALAAPTEDAAYKHGVEMIMTQFNQTMEKLGVVEIPALGEKFDPKYHNAVMHVDDAEKGENEIVEVFQKGFKIGDKVVRTSMVKVAN